MPHFQIVQVVTFVVAFTMAATRILSATKAFWSFLPQGLAGVLPSLVVALPALGEAVAGAQSWTDLTVAFITAAALLLPGAHSHTVEIKKPNGPTSGAGTASALLLVVALSVTQTSCAVFGGGGSFWPAVAECAPSKSSLVSQVEDLLLAGGDYEAALKDLAIKDGAAVVECAVRAAVDSLTAKGSKIGASDGSAIGAARGKAFLAKTGTKFEDRK